MGNDVTSTPIDFTKQYVIAVVVPASDRVVRLRPVSLQKDAKGNFVFTEDFGVKQTYKSSTDLIILVDKKVNVKVLLQETKKSQVLLKGQFPTLFSSWELALSGA